MHICKSLRNITRVSNSNQLLMQKQLVLSKIADQDITHMDIGVEHRQDDVASNVRQYIIKNLHILGENRDKGHVIQGNIPHSLMNAVNKLQQYQNDQAEYPSPISYDSSIMLILDLSKEYENMITNRLSEVSNNIRDADEKNLNIVSQLKATCELIVGKSLWYTIDTNQSTFNEVKKSGSLYAGQDYMGSSMSIEGNPLNKYWANQHRILELDNSIAFLSKVRDSMPESDSTTNDVINQIDNSIKVLEGRKQNELSLSHEDRLLLYTTAMPADYKVMIHYYDNKPISLKEYVRRTVACTRGVTDIWVNRNGRLTKAAMWQLSITKASVLSSHLGKKNMSQDIKLCSGKTLTVKELYLENTTSSGGVKIANKMLKQNSPDTNPTDNEFNDIGNCRWGRVAIQSDESHNIIASGTAMLTASVHCKEAAEQYVKTMAESHGATELGFVSISFVNGDLKLPRIGERKLYKKHVTKIDEAVEEYNQANTCNVKVFHLNFATTSKSMFWASNAKKIIRL